MGQGFFEFQQPSFPFHTRSVACQRAVRPNDAVTGYDDGDGIEVAGLCHRPCSPRIPYAGCQSTIGEDGAIGNVAEFFPYPLPEGCPFKHNRQGKLGAPTAEVLVELSAYSICQHGILLQRAFPSLLPSGEALCSPTPTAGCDVAVGKRHGKLTEWRRMEKTHGHGRIQ